MPINITVVHLPTILLWKTLISADADFLTPLQDTLEKYRIVIMYMWHWLPSLVAQTVKNLPAIQETWVWSLGQEDPLGKRMVTHFQYSCLENATDRGSQRVGHNGHMWHILSKLPTMSHSRIISLYPIVRLAVYTD